MATTPESYRITGTIDNEDILTKFQKLQDDHVGLQQILRNRVLPQQENADELISESISKCRSIFSKKILEVKTEMKEMSRRIDDLADSVEKELNELDVLVESLRAEQKRMKSSLPPEVLPPRLSLNRKSLTPKSISSPKLIKKKENLHLQKVEVLPKAEFARKESNPSVLVSPLKEIDIPNNTLKAEKFEEVEKRIFEEEEKPGNHGEKIKRRPSLAEALWERMTSPNFNCPLEVKKGDSKHSPNLHHLPEGKNSSHTSPSNRISESPEIQDQLISNVTSRNKRCYESKDVEPPIKKQKESQNSDNSSLDLFASEDEEEKNKISLDENDDVRISKIASESFVKPLGSSDLVMMKVFPQTAKSPALSLIPEETTVASTAVTPAPARKYSRPSRPRVPSKSRSPSPHSEDNSEISEHDLSTGRRVRRAAAQIKSFKEPSLNKKLRQPRKKKT